jgi:hypothetical protein
MKLTPTILKNIYAMLYCCEPFSKWKLPLPEEIKFIVDYDPETMGTYCYDEGNEHEHTITISASRCGFLETVIKTIAHEMIHASRSGTVSDAWLKHDASFRRKAHQIGVSCGFDPLEL